MALGTIAKTGSNRSVEGQMDGSGRWGYTDAKQHHSAIRKQSITLDPVLEEKVEMIIPRKGGMQGERLPYDITSSRNLKMDTNELLY